MLVSFHDNEIFTALAVCLNDTVDKVVMSFESEGLRITASSSIKTIYIFAFFDMFFFDDYDVPTACEILVDAENLLHALRFGGKFGRCSINVTEEKIIFDFSYGDGKNKKVEMRLLCDNGKSESLVKFQYKAYIELPVDIFRELGQNLAKNDIYSFLVEANERGLEFSHEQKGSKFTTQFEEKAWNINIVEHFRVRVNSYGLDAISKLSKTATNVIMRFSDELPTTIVLQENDRIEFTFLVSSMVDDKEFY